ncbi:uncharacterized protein LOC135825734 [Sycon ciliatum]|uniref:uncharacterized protein LOC135825734 n=1 Tax=Sycon ciliatum TaxID=27933 RepID=UPI0031F6E3B8
MHGSSWLFVLAALVGSAMAAGNHTCCPRTAPWTPLFCTRSVCEDAMTFNTTSVILFAGACPQGMVNSTFTCAVNYIPRSSYESLYTVKLPLLQPTKQYRDQIQQNQATSIILGVGCYSKAKTAICRDGLRSIVSNVSAAVLGSAAGFRLKRGKLTLNYSISTLALECLASGNPDSQEWNGGMSACAATGLGDSTKPDNFTSGLVKVGGSTCTECQPLVGKLPFCAALFSSKAAKRYSPRCSSLNITQSQGNDKCMKLVRAVACRAAMSPCESASTGGKAWCSKTCQDSFTGSCGVTTAAATTICTALDVTSTQCDAKSPPDHSAFRLGKSASAKRRILKYQLCVAPGNTSDFLLVLDSVVRTLCSSQDCSGEVEKSGSGVDANNETCDKYNTTVNAPSTFSAAVFKIGVAAQLGVSPSTLDVSDSEVFQTVVEPVTSDNSAAAALPTVSAVSLFLVALLAAYSAQ